ncbi:MAG: FAD-dependent oxidoreductase [bacterium]
MQDRKVVIVGAGIGGLAAGYRLQQRGFEVEVLEASDRPGGRMMTLERKGDRVDVGAQFYHTNGRYGLELIDAMGMGGSKRRTAGNKAQYALKNGSAYVHDPHAPYAKLFGLKGNLNLYAFILRYVIFGRRFPDYGITVDIPEYDNTSIVDLYRSPSDRAFLDYLVTPLAMGSMIARPEWMSLYHYIRMFRSTLAASLLSLTRGISSLAEEVARRLPVRYEAPVQRLVMEKGRVVGVEMAGDGSVRKAGHVIVATTPAAAAPLLPDELEEQRRFLASVLYTPIPMAVFFLDRPLRKDVLFYFTDPGLRTNYTFAINEQAKAPEMFPSGKSAVTGWAVYPTSSGLMKESDAEILNKAKEDMELMIPGISGWTEEARVVRHPFVNALFTPGAHRAILDFIEQAKRLRGVSFVSCVLSGSGMEAAVRSAEAAVQRICGWGGGCP